MKTDVLISNTLYVIGIIVIILLSIGILLLIYKLKKAKAQKQEFEEKYNSLELKVNGLKLETLESKLNPTFILCSFPIRASLIISSLL